MTARSRQRSPTISRRSPSDASPVRDGWRLIRQQLWTQRWGILGGALAGLAWTASKLKEARVQYFLGAHCTGIEAVFRIRQALGLPRKQALVGAVGASFTLGTGIDPKALAQ